MKKFRILADMDSIIAAFLDEVKARVESRYPHIVFNIGAIPHFYKMPEALSSPLPDGVHVDNIFKEHGFFEALKPIAGAKESLQQLKEDGHEIVVVSTPCHSQCAKEKIDWMAKHFPFLDQKSVWLGHKKHHVRGDILIDDAPHNVSAYRAEHPNALTYTLPYSYNLADQDMYTLRPRYQDPYIAWQMIVMDIRRQSQE